MQSMQQTRTIRLTDYCEWGTTVSETAAFYFVFAVTRLAAVEVRSNTGC